MKHVKSERAQSLVEMAVSIVILVYLLSGAVEFGILFFQYVQLRDAAQEGALFGSIQAGTTETAIEDRVMASSFSPINMAAFNRNDIVVDVYSAPPASTLKGTGQAGLNLACEGDGLRVTVNFTHKIFMPFIPWKDREFHLVARVTDTILLSNPAAPGCP
jgi:Flp pilus assembly protein TadG